MTAEIDPEDIVALLNNLAKYSAPVYDPEMFADCKFAIEGNKIKLASGYREEGERLLDIKGVAKDLSKFRAEKVQGRRRAAEIAISDINIDNLRTGLAARLMEKLTERIWFGNYSPGKQAIEANQFEEAMAPLLGRKLRQSGIIKNHEDLEVVPVEDWHQARIGIDSIDLNILLAEVERMGRSRLR